MGRAGKSQPPAALRFLWKRSVFGVCGYELLIVLLIRLTATKALPGETFNWKRLEGIVAFTVSPI
ncbi:hypothetical protein PPNSA23_40840 [Phyllobacterium phragmitis]|uniref:Uncharacterized protein n=1 Tax=Phyllobacterium phragmitis TaxID=2670329 RepID=A0ABQ0H5I4_9HYPH